MSFVETYRMAVAHLESMARLESMKKRKNAQEIQAEIFAAKPGTLVELPPATEVIEGVMQEAAGDPGSPVPYTGPVYEYCLPAYTILNVHETFSKLGREGWIFLGREAAGYSVFYRKQENQ